MILLIGDGMGITQISAGIYVKYNQAILEDFSVIGLSKTHASNSLVSGSATCGVAIDCWEKKF